MKSNCLKTHLQLMSIPGFDSRRSTISVSPSRAAYINGVKFK